MLQKKEEKGITLVALVITIIVLIILAGIAISMTLGENGIFTRAKEAKILQITAEAKEKIGADILDAQIEAAQKDEELQQSKVEEIIAKYGELQADGDTIKLKDNGYEISLKEIYNGTTSSSGDSTGGSTGSAELDSLKAELAKTTATEDKILKDYKAYSNGKLMTGTMENYAGQTVAASAIIENGENAEITIPQAGYYGTDSKVSIPVETIKQDVETINNSLGVKIDHFNVGNTAYAFSRMRIDTTEYSTVSVDSLVVNSGSTLGYFKIEGKKISTGGSGTVANITSEFSTKKTFDISDYSYIELILYVTGGTSGATANNIIIH